MQSQFLPSSTPGELMIISHWGVLLYGLYIDLSGIFNEKVGTFSEFLCLMEASKIRLRAVLEKIASIFKKLS